MRKSAAKLIISLGVLIAFSKFTATPILGQAQNLTAYCQQIASLPTPSDNPNPIFQEPKWSELIVTGNKDGRGRLRTGSGSITINSANLPFAKMVADYLEGNFQDEAHRLANINILNSVQFQSYNGPAVELLPQKVADRLRVAYVREIISKINNNITKLEEATFDYTDACGNNPRSIKDLVDVWGLPNPPSLGGNYDNWAKTWQRYWLKIPTVVNYQMQACINFTEPTPAGIVAPSCPSIATNDSIKIGVPDIFRLNQLASVVQQIMVPQQLIQEGVLLERGSNGPEGFGSAIKLYDSNGNPANQVTISPPAEKNQVVGIFPFSFQIWRKLIGKGRTVMSGALPSFINSKDQISLDLTADAKVPISASEELPVYVRWLGGVQNAVIKILESLHPSDLK